MIRIAFEFLAGRYHATPWGRHVNEGAIEWPPSPWRVLRGLIATGYAKLGWSEVPVEGRRLTEALAAHLPTYWLPPEITAGHTRHYMPKGGVAKYDAKKDVYNRGTDLVIDAFGSMPRERVGLVAQWAIELDPSLHDFLCRLVTAMGHLGRAEAWTEMTVMDSIPAGFLPCRPGDGPPDVAWERIELLAPLPEVQYQDWRATWTARQSLERTKSKAGAEPAATVVDALQTTTTMLQKDGWSQPPGSQWVGYWRHPGAIVERPAKREPARRSEGSRPTSALLALASDTVNGEVLPGLTEAIWQGEAIHGALVSLAADEETRLSPESLTGRDPTGSPLVGHRHAHVLPLTLDRRDGRIDHVLVHAPMGFDVAAVRGIQRLRHTFAAKLPRLYVTLVGLGGTDDIGRRVPELGTARVWESRTPFVPPRHLKGKGKDTLIGQVSAECESRGLAKPVHVEVEIGAGPAESGRAGTSGRWLDALRYAELRARLDGRPLQREISGDPLPAGMRFTSRWRHFRRARRNEAKRPPTLVAVGLRLTFAEAVQGPIALGYGSHFGLGLMRPAREQV